MALYVGLDVGTTTFSAVVFDAETGDLLVRSTVANTADATSPEEKARGRAELDLTKFCDLVIQFLAETVAKLTARGEEISGIGVTGQQHGVALVRPDVTPLAPAITWQDRRLEEKIPGSDETYLQRFISLAGGLQAFARMGCVPAAGYLGPTLFWLHLNNQLPQPPALACFIPDAAVAFLTGRPPCTEPTDGGSSGIFDIVSRQWAWDLIDRWGLPREIFPEVREPGDLAGELLPAIADQIGVPEGTPVFVALGDNQASFMGSVREPTRSILLNVGTGGQVSAQVDEFHRLPGLDTRYFPGGRYLLVGGGSAGGRSYGYLRNFFRQVGAGLFEGSGDEELYDEMTRLAAAVPAGAEGLCCSPLFTGSRVDPALRGSITGIGVSNFSPGHVARALLEGMGEVFFKFYEQMQPLVGLRDHLVGSGNGIRLNRLLAEILAKRFDMPLYIPALEEEAAAAAAMLAAVGAGDLDSLDAAARLLQYAEVVTPDGEDGAH